MSIDAPSRATETYYETSGPGIPDGSGRTPRRVGLTQRSGKFDVKVSPYLYISPFFISFAIFGIFPILYNVYIAIHQVSDFRSLTNPDIPTLFVGWANFTWVLEQPRFWNALGNTFSIWLLSAIPQLLLALLIAAVLDQNLRAKTFWRMAVLVPYVVLPIATAMIFAELLGQRGVIVPFLGPGGWFGEVGLFGLNPQGNPWNNPFFQSRFWSHIAIATMVNFRWTGYNALIFLAAMQAVPRELYEAAVVDGASRLRQFFSVTIPSIRPTMIFVILTMTIGGLQVFDEVVMFDTTGSGGASRQFETMVLYMFNLGFGNWQNQQLGRAAAVAWVFALIILLVGLINFFLTRAISSAGPKQSKVSSSVAKRAVADRRAYFNGVMSNRANGLDETTDLTPVACSSLDNYGNPASLTPADYVTGESPAEFFEQHNADY